MTIKESRRPAFEQAVIDRMKEGGFLEVEIRVECLARSGDGYYDGSVDAYWHFWNAALDGVVIELPHPVPSICKAGKGRGDEVTFHLLNKEGDPIGGDPAGGYANDNARLRAELAAIKAQEPAAWVHFHNGEVYYDRDHVISNEPGDCLDDGHEWRPVYAAPAAKPQGVVMPERETELFNAAYGAAVESGWESVKCMARQIWDAARLSAAPVQQVSVPDVSAMARILADRNADACNVNREDNWAIYGQDYIDAALSAVCAAAPNIATTSEHSGS